MVDPSPASFFFPTWRASQVEKYPSGSTFFVHLSLKVVDHADSKAHFPSFPALTLWQRGQSTSAGINCTCLNIRLIRLSGIIYFYTDNSSQMFWKITHFIFSAAKTHRFQHWHEQGRKFGSAVLIIGFSVSRSLRHIESEMQICLSCTMQQFHQGEGQTWTWGKFGSNYIWSNPQFQCPGRGNVWTLLITDSVSMFRNARIN